MLLVVMMVDLHAAYIDQLYATTSGLGEQFQRLLRAEIVMRLAGNVQGIGAQAVAAAGFRLSNCMKDFGWNPVPAR